MYKYLFSNTEWCTTILSDVQVYDDDEVLLNDVHTLCFHIMFWNKFIHVCLYSAQVTVHHGTIPYNLTKAIVHTHTHMPMYTYIHIYTCMHTHICTYVTSLPPSSGGGFHFKFILSLVISFTSRGPPGRIGGPEIQTLKCLTRRMKGIQMQFAK